MKKQIKVSKTRTARVITIPADYFKIHEAHKEPIEAFDFEEMENGKIILIPVRKQPVIHQRNSIPRAKRG